MTTKQLTEEVRTRVTEEQKKRIEALAVARQLSVSDVLREAVNRYLGSKKGTA